MDFYNYDELETDDDDECDDDSGANKNSAVAYLEFHKGSQVSRNTEEDICGNMKMCLLLLCCIVATSLACRVTRNMKKIAKQAKNHVGSKIWSKASKHKLGADTNKCNIFVAEMIEKAGASLPHRHWWSRSPIGATEWANQKSRYLTRSGCWKNVKSACRGDVMAEFIHVGIVTGTKKTTSASSRVHKVVTNNWGLE
ncbi:hypothetical protein LSAT2_026486 [Lamellibrachia satsuma]|nr:hypothetical protein LSAT2_026486 [Lamellibrachia satsuma]